jgi:hypothetical protein
MFTKYIMPNRDWTWPQGKGPMTGAKMWSCWDAAYGQGKNVTFGRWQGKICEKWLRKWMGNRWNSVAESEGKTITEGE